MPQTFWQVTRPAVAWYQFDSAFPRASTHHPWSSEEVNMSDNGKTTGAANGALWGARAADWSAIQEGQCRPVYEAVLNRLKVGPGMAYLDAGCGAGMAAQMARERGAEVSGLDAAEPLLAIARERVPAGKFIAGDLEELPLADATFDVVTGFNSFQYAGDPIAALAEARRVTKPGGVVAIVTWGPPEGMPAAALVGALRPLLPPPPPGAPGPFALSNETALRAFAHGAGLEPGEIFDVESPWSYASLEEGIRGLGSSGVAARARSTSGAEAVDRAHAEALGAFRQSDGSFRVPAVFRCLVAYA
jgi:ubiquinone/menaquinone biosynthesis C-methylase UbiE